MMKPEAPNTVNCDSISPTGATMCRPHDLRKERAASATAKRGVDTLKKMQPYSLIQATNGPIEDQQQPPRFIPPPVGSNLTSPTEAEPARALNPRTEWPEWFGERRDSRP